MKSEDALKQQAIETHSLQAALFSDRYRKFQQDPYDNCFAYSRKQLDRWLERYLCAQSKGLRLLDVGCGTGHQMAWLRQCGFHVAGVDGSPEMIERALANNPGVDIRQADVERLPFPDSSFDVVLSVEVLRYLPQTQNCIQEMGRVLKPGGMCLVTAVPLFNLNAYWLINRLTSVVPVGNLVRLRQFFTTSRRLRREFRQAGFARVEVHGVYCGPINWIERLAPKSLPRFLRAWESVDQKVTDWPILRELSNMFLVWAIRNR